MEDVQSDICQLHLINYSHRFVWWTYIRCRGPNYPRWSMKNGLQTTKIFRVTGRRILLALVYINTFKFAGFFYDNAPIDQRVKPSRAFPSRVKIGRISLNKILIA